MDYSKNEILAHLRGVKQANETMLKSWKLNDQKNTKLQIELDLINELLFKFDDKTKKPGE
jgi:hypothetical protein